MTFALSMHQLTRGEKPGPGGGTGPAVKTPRLLQHRFKRSTCVFLFPTRVCIIGDVLSVVEPVLRWAPLMGLQCSSLTTLHPRLRFGCCLRCHPSARSRRICGPSCASRSSSQGAQLHLETPPRGMTSSTRPGVDGSRYRLSLSRDTTT